MRRLILVALAAAGSIAAQANQPAAAVQGPRELFDRYCVSCHNQKLKTANLQLDTLDLAQVPQNSPVLEKVVRKLRAGMMPPAGMRRPDPAVLEAAIEKLETALDRQ